MKVWLVLLLFGAALLDAAPSTIPNVPLVNQDGKPFQLYDLKGQYVFVSFIYTRCPMPKMCPLTVSLNNRLVTEWKKSRGIPPLRALGVTLDPDFDQPAVLKRFAIARKVDSGHFTLATGAPQALAALASEFNVIGVSAEGFISHNMKSVLLSPTMREVKEYRDNEWTPAQVLKDLKDAAKN